MMFGARFGGPYWLTFSLVFGTVPAGCREPEPRPAPTPHASSTAPRVMQVAQSTPPKPADAKPAEARPAPTAQEPQKESSNRKDAAKQPPTGRQVFTAANNPTTMAGRGNPDLDNPQSPAAWIYIDGRGGQYKEEGGQKLLQWFIEEPVAASPRFRVEAYEPLLGTPRDFKAVLRTVESPGGTDIVYAIAANDGTFEVGKEYSLLSPGDNFVIRNGATGDIVKEIAALPIGTYALAAGIKNAQTGKQTLAVTYFTVEFEE